MSLSGPGLWELIADRAGTGIATAAQLRAAAFMAGDVPAGAILSESAARELLSVRAYVVELLAAAERAGSMRHPREAARVILEIALREPDVLRSIRTWSGDRWRQERGTARIGRTRHAPMLTDALRRRCRLPVPTALQSRVHGRAAFAAAGFAPLLGPDPVTILYDGPSGRLARTIREIRLEGAWPEWACWLVDPVGFFRVTAHCDLRGERRTFSPWHILEVRSL